MTEVSEEPTAPLEEISTEIPEGGSRPAPTLPNPNVGLRTGRPARPVRPWRDYRYVRTRDSYVEREYDLVAIAFHVGLIAFGVLIGWLLFAPHSLSFSFH